MALFDFMRPQPDPNSGKAPEPTNSGSAAKIHTFNLKYDYTSPYETLYRTGNGFTFGADNRYPDELNHLYYQSPLHSGILNFKKNITVGDGYEIEGYDTMPMSQQVALKQITFFFDQFYEELTLNYFVHNSIYLSVNWNEDNSKIIAIDHIPPERMRIDEINDMLKPTSYFHSFDWTQLARFPRKTIPAFDPYNKNAKLQAMAFHVKGPGFKLYPKPTYTSGLNWIVLDSQMALYHKANIVNSLNPSMLIKFFYEPGSIEEEQAILDNLNDSFAGAQKTGRVMTIFNDGVLNAPEVVQLEPNKLDKTFVSLGDIIQRQIIYSHGMNPDLLGLPTPGSLGQNGNELEIIYKIFNQHIVKPAQKNIENMINRILSINKIPAKITFKESDIFKFEAALDELKATAAAEAIKKGGQLTP